MKWLLMVSGIIAVSVSIGATLGVFIGIGAAGVGCMWLSFLVSGVE